MKEKKWNEVLLFSGGMDSFMAYKILGKPKTLYVKMDHRYQDEEIKRVLALVPDTRILDMPVLGQFEEEDATIPMRNLFLAMMAALQGYTLIWVVTQKDEMSIPDRSMDFMSKASDMLSSLMGREIVVQTPFEKLDKTDMVQLYIDEGHNIDELLKTWACYYPVRGEHCGNCPACFRRFVALKNCKVNPGYKLSTEIKDYYREKLESYPLSRIRRMSPHLVEEVGL